jgi:type IV pilus assembly protein PilA
MSIFAKAKKAKENKKGFTLVELIVVLVILAILAAILVPALLGWIDKAKEKQIVVNARTVYLAAQTVVSEEYGTATSTTSATYNVPSAQGSTNASVEKAIQTLADVSVTYSSAITVTNSKVTGMTYTEGSYTATLTIKDGKASWSVAKAAQ